MLNIGGTVSVFYSQTPTAAFFVTSPQTELIALRAYVNVISLMPVEKKIILLVFPLGDLGDVACYSVATNLSARG